MTPKSWPCVYCTQLISEIGAYVKLTASKYAHLVCHNQAVSAATRVAVEQEQAAQRAEQELREARERQEQAERERAREERRAEVAERERTNRIEAQRAMPLPPRVSAEREEAARRAIAEGKSVVLPAPGEVPERPKSRFELIEMDDELVEEKE